MDECTSNKEGNQATCIHNPPRVKDGDIIFMNTPATLNKQQYSLHVHTTIICHSHTCTKCFRSSFNASCQIMNVDVTEAVTDGM